MSSNIAVHLNPIWRDQSNFLIFADVREGDMKLEWEQLWTRQISDNRFVLCCIPFFIYDLALGDEVETHALDSHSYVVKRVVKPSGHWTLRLWFGDAEPDGIGETLAHLTALPGCLYEAYSRNYIGVDAATFEIAKQVVPILAGLQQSGRLKYETGWR
jgi:hypothetical protein